MAVTNPPGPYQARTYDDLADSPAASQRNPTDPGGPMTTTPVLPDGFVAYFAARIAAEADRVDAVLGAMTRRERALVREVAVMAGVRATMRAGSREQVPPDGEVVRDAVGACLHMDDLYPTISRLERVAMRNNPARGGPMTDTTTVTDEIAAMRRIVATLDRLDPTTRDRVVRWLGDRYGLPLLRVGEDTL